ATRRSFTAQSLHTPAASREGQVWPEVQRAGGAWRRLVHRGGHVKRFALVAVLALLLAPVARAEDARQDLGKTSGERLMDEAVKKLRSRYYDRERRSKIDWDGLVERYRQELRATASPHEAHGLINRALGELKTSHLALIEGTVYERELACEFAAKT